MPVSDVRFSTDYVRSYPESGRNPWHLFTAAVDPKQTSALKYDICALP
jgi:hypothetical protein